MITTESLSKYIQHIKDDYLNWSDNGSAYVKAFNVEYKIGRKYIKVTTNNSVHSFIVIKETDKFKIGDILMAASYNAPATNFSRGNILENDFSLIRWTGAI
jgi:hypothetical protein